MPKSELVVPFFLKALLAMLLQLYASVTARLESFVSLANEALHPLSLWQALALTALRNSIFRMFASYFRCAEFFKDTIGLEEIAAVTGAIFVSAVLATACSLPFEYVMIQINKMQPDANGKYPYTGFFDCAVKTFKGGPLNCFTGFPVYCARISLQLTALLAMLLQLYASVTSGFESFVNLANEAFHPLSLWQNLALTALWSSIFSVSALYFRCAEFFNDTIGLEEMAAVAGGISVSIVFAAACSLPFEYVMIQIKKMQPNADGNYPYNGCLDCAVKTFKGGPLKFYTIFPVYCVKISLHLVVLLVFSSLSPILLLLLASGFMFDEEIRAPDVEGSLSLVQDTALYALRAVALFASYSGSLPIFRVYFRETSAPFYAGLVSIIFAAYFSCPFESVMTQIQKMKPDAEGHYRYTGYIDCAVKTFKEGRFEFFCGYSEDFRGEYFSRVSPYLIAAGFFLYDLLKEK